MSDDVRTRWRRELGRRLREERERLGLGQGELARKLGVSKQLASFWESGKSELMLYTLSKMRGLGLDAGYILAGAHSGAGLPVKLPTNVVPHPSHPEILQIAAGKLDPSRIERTRPVITENVANGMAVDLLDVGLEPRLPAGTILIIDRDRRPETGQIVCVALLRTAEVMLRRYSHGRGQRFTLHPDNQLLPTREITEQHEPVVVGVMIEAVLQGSR